VRVHHCHNAARVDPRHGSPRRRCYTPRRNTALAHLLRGPHLQPPAPPSPHSVRTSTVLRIAQSALYSVYSPRLQSLTLTRSHSLFSALCLSAWLVSLPFLLRFSLFLSSCNCELPYALFLAALGCPCARSTCSRCRRHWRPVAAPRRTPRLLATRACLPMRLAHITHRARSQR